MEVLRPKYLELYGKALAIQRESLSPKHPDVGTSYSNMGIVYTTQGRFEDALKHYSLALQIRCEALGDKHPDVSG